MMANRARSAAQYRNLVKTPPKLVEPSDEDIAKENLENGIELCLIA